eukprot:7105284-Pyramimonas_sp.AAC.1
MTVVKDKKRKLCNDGISMIDSSDKFVSDVLKPKLAFSSVVKILAFVIGMTISPAHGEEIVARESLGPGVMKEIVSSNPDFVIADTTETNISVVRDFCEDLAQNNGSVTVTFGYQNRCSNKEITDALNSYLESDDDLQSPNFVRFLRDLGRQIRLYRLVSTAFPAEAAAERMVEPFDSVEDAEDVATAPQEMLRDEEQDIIEGLPLPGEPTSEGERRKAWLKVSLRVRIVIRRLHRQFGHCPNRVLVQLMRLSRMREEYIDAVENYR